MEREVKRLEQFRQLRRDIRGTQDYLVVGLDISKDIHNALMTTVSGKIHRRLTFHNTREGFENLLLAVEAVKVQHGLSGVVFGMEPTANYHKPLAEFLINRDQQVVLVSPEAAKQNRSLLDGRWNKHDGKDCANVADLICQGKCLYYEVPVTGAARSAQPLITEPKAKETGAGIAAAHTQPCGGAVLPGDGSVLSLGSHRGVGPGAMVFGFGGDGRPQSRRAYQAAGNGRENHRTAKALVGTQRQGAELDRLSVW
jgi:hypothetical protein